METIISKILLVRLVCEVKIRNLGKSSSERIVGGLQLYFTKCQNLNGKSESILMMYFCKDLGVYINEALTPN